MIIRCPDFSDGERIPKKFTCDGKNINPTLYIDDIPKSAKELALIVDDPDAPLNVWVHWVVYKIPITNTIKENTIPGIQGINDFKKKNYGGPCPPSGEHRYFFKLYALHDKLNLIEGLTKSELLVSIKGHIIEDSQLVGLYSRE